MERTPTPVPGISAFNGLLNAKIIVSDEADNASANNITINADSNDNINGGADGGNIVISADGGSVSMEIANKTDWAASSFDNSPAPSGGLLQSAKVTIPSAEILQLNSTPKELVPAPGAGKMIVLLNAAVRLTFGSSVYTTNITLNIQTAGANYEQSQFFNALGWGSDTFVVRSNSSGVAGNIALAENQALQAVVPSGNPAAGDSDIDVYIQYAIVDI